MIEKRPSTPLGVAGMWVERCFDAVDDVGKDLLFLFLLFFLAPLFQQATTLA